MQLLKQFNEFIIIIKLLDTSWYGVSNENSNKEKPRTLSLDLDKNPVTSSTSSLTSGSSTRRSTARHQPHPQTNTKIMVVWLESYEDHLQFPIGRFYIILFYNQQNSFGTIRKNC